MISPSGQDITDIVAIVGWGAVALHGLYFLITEVWPPKK
jgi:hypothetical protein